MKTFIAAIITALTCVTGFGQGTIYFQNGGPGLNAPVFSGDSVTKLSGSQYRAGLLVGLDPNPDFMWDAGISVPFATGAAAGYFFAGVREIPGVPIGRIMWVRVVAWDATAGATFREALASCHGRWGQSAVFSVVTGGGTNPPPYLIGLTSFNVWICLGAPVPTFTSQPTNQTVVAGGNATFFVEATACPMPAYYQWYFNGALIPSANGSSYHITSVQPTHAGTYHAVLGNPCWWEPKAYASASATLTVLTQPIITSGPQSQTAFEGDTAGFQVSATGTLPLAYRWLFNGTSMLNSATDWFLPLTNVQSGQAGAYAVVVSNAFGAVTSAPALLRVIPPVERRWVPGLLLMGQPGNSLNLDASEVLAPAPNWTTFDSVMLTNASQWYFDLSEPLPPQRFFRAWQAGVPAAPVLNAYMIPALTLTGSVGSAVRMGGINQFGPTDAWFPLDTVTLTNASQLYFDVSVIGQPPRLWRIVPMP